MPVGEPRSEVEQAGEAAVEADILDTAHAGPAAVRGGLLRAGGYGVGLMLTLASAPLLVRHLGSADFGRYSAVLAVVAIITGLTEAGVNTIALREQSVLRGGEQLAVMSDLLGIRLALSLLGVVAAVGFAAIAGYGSTLVLGTFLAGIGMVLTVTQTLLATTLQARMRFGWMASAEILRQALTAAIVIALVLAGAGVVSFLAVGIPAGAASLALTIWFVRGMTARRASFDVRSWVPLLRDTFTYAVAIAVNSLYFRITLVLMSLVSTATQTGYFAISFRVIEVLSGIPVLIIGAAFPIIARSARTDQVRFQYATGRLFELGVVAGTLAMVCVLLGAEFAVRVLAGHEADPAVTVLRIQGLGIAATFVAAATGFPLLGLRMHKETLIANLTSLVLAVSLTLALAPGLGARGGAIAAVAAEFALGAVNAWVLVHSPGRPKLPLGIIPIALVAAAGGLGAGLLVGIHPVVQTAVGALTYTLLLLVLGRFPPEAKELFTHRANAPATATR
jgi:O-antigen/teichoic acid export membrane protein